MQDESFPARFSTYDEYKRMLQRTRDAGGFLLEVSEKPIIHFLGLHDWGKDILVSFEANIRSQADLDSIIQGIRFTPLFRQMFTYILTAYQLHDYVLIQGMPKIGKTYAYRTFKNFIIGPEAEYIYLDCTPDTSQREIVDALRGAFIANNGEGAFLLVDHFDNLPLDTQVLFRAVGYGDRTESFLRDLNRGTKTFVGLEATFPEIVKGKNIIEAGVAARVSAWLAISSAESEKYSS